MSMMNCDRCGELRDSDWIEFFDTEEGDICIYCAEEEDDI